MFQPLPSIIGVNNHECGFLLPMKEFPEVFQGVNKSYALKLVHINLRSSAPFLQLVAEEYFQDEQSELETRDVLLDLLGDVFFVAPGLVTAQYQRDSGAPVYFYEFQHRPHCFADSKPAFVKADHTDEIRFVFGGAFLTGDMVMFEGATEEEKTLSRKMMRYWANFARSGNPNGVGLPRWPVFNSSQEYLKLDLDISVGRQLKERRAAFWSRAFPALLSAGAGHCPLLSLTLCALALHFFPPAS